MTDDGQLGDDVGVLHLCAAHIAVAIPDDADLRLHAGNGDAILHRLLDDAHFQRVGILRHQMRGFLPRQCDGPRVDIARQVSAGRRQHLEMVVRFAATDRGNMIPKHAFGQQPLEERGQQPALASGLPAVEHRRRDIGPQGALRFRVVGAHRQRQGRGLVSQRNEGVVRDEAQDRVVGAVLKQQASALFAEIDGQGLEVHCGRLDFRRWRAASTTDGMAGCAGPAAPNSGRASRGTNISSRPSRSATANSVETLKS